HCSSTESSPRVSLVLHLVRVRFSRRSLRPVLPRTDEGLRLVRPLGHPAPSRAHAFPRTRLHRSAHRARAREAPAPHPCRAAARGVVLLDLDERGGAHRRDDARQGNDRGARGGCLLPRPRRGRRARAHAAHRGARVVVLPPARGARPVSGQRAARRQPRIGSTLGGSRAPAHAAHRGARGVVLPPARGDRPVSGQRAARRPPRIGSTLGGFSPGGVSTVSTSCFPVNRATASSNCSRSARTAASASPAASASNRARYVPETSAGTANPSGREKTAILVSTARLDM